MRRQVLILLGAGALAALLTAFALAKSSTLKIAENVHVTNDPTKAFRVQPVDKHEAVAIGPAGYAVYTFQGETTHHIICKKTSSTSTNCWGFWPPVAVRSAAVSKPKGISGRLGTFRNHGTLQLTLNGQPLYYFTPDLQSHNKRQATGDELKTFGSIWHIVAAHGKIMRGPTSTTQTTPTTSPSTTTSPYSYPY